MLPGHLKVKSAPAARRGPFSERMPETRERREGSTLACVPVVEGAGTRGGDRAAQGSSWSTEVRAHARQRRGSAAHRLRSLPTISCNLAAARRSLASCSASPSKTTYKGSVENLNRWFSLTSNTLPISAT